MAFTGKPIEHAAVFAAFTGGSNNSPRRSLAQLRAQSYLRAFICSVLALRDAHLYLFVAPQSTFRLLSSHLRHSQLHILPMATGSSSRLQHARYTMYLALLAELGNVSKLVLADASDVVFQASPFELIQQGLYSAEEAASYTLGSHTVNAMWVRELYGAAMLRSIAHHHVVCSGLTMGTAAAVQRYLEWMAAESAARLSSERLDELRRKHGRELCRGFDQGLHNVAVRKELSALAHILPAGRSELFNGNAMHCDVEVELNESRLVYASPLARTVPLVVAHQYGRVHGRCQRSVRRTLTCRQTVLALPRHCDVCTRLWPEWLGDSLNSWRASTD